MLIKTNELTGIALDWAVAQVENTAWEEYDRALFADATLPPRPSEYLRDNIFTTFIGFARDPGASGLYFFAHLAFGGGVHRGFQISLRILNSPVGVG